MSYEQPLEIPYDPGTPDYTPETLPLDAIIREAIRVGGMGLRVAVPAKIVRVRGSRQVDVQPLLQARYSDGTMVDLPIIQNCLVQMPFGALYGERMPLAEGDNGLALFADRSLDIWKSSEGQIVDPQDSRAHDLQDCVFLPGLATFPQQEDEDEDDEDGEDWVWANGEAELRLGQEIITLQNNQTTLMTALGMLIDAVEAMQMKNGSYQVSVPGSDFTAPSGGGPCSGTATVSVTGISGVVDDTSALENARDALQSLLG